ncbi:thiamine pyrophosphate-binding protein [Halorubellus sp. JP-L1]|uniref:thiamine pyrophosphate-binding protein n=1 Tax=Halorubellus sp. JP-L1 TaxID=2715753 RepID=UPI00140B58F3|nr:thiamine pyrophosphate-dependent enzyme [Halorubellus sp. JP-L1]NHN40609.1 thiamine pyrophosphate-binding protein [Halorubellus sp. JP-L1]
MSEYTGADLFVDALETYGIEHVFGNPGTTELPVTRALADGDVEYVLGLHEDVAVGAAAGYASTRLAYADELDGLPAGVVNLHVAPGTAHGLGNLYDASITGAPLVVTAGAHGRGFRHEEPILEGDTVAMTEEFTKWSAEVLDVEALPTMLRRAFRVACTPPTGPVFLALPLDVMRAETDARPEDTGGIIQNPGRGDPAALEEAANRVVDANDPVLVVGDHVPRHAAHSAVDPVAAAVAFAEAAGARVHGEILSSEASFPTDHDQWVSHIPPSEEFAQALLNTDTIVFAGTSTNTTLWDHDEPLVPGDPTCVHLASDPWEVAKNQPGTGVTGDLGHLLADLAERVDARLDEAEREKRLDGVAAMKTFAESKVAELASSDVDDPRPSKPDLVDALRAVAPDAYVVDEGVTAKYALLSRWDFEPGDLTSNKGGGLGYGLPASVGAALAESMRPERERRDVVGFVGDGSYMYYPQSVQMAASLGVDLTVVVVDNRNYRILKENQRAMFGDDEDEADFVGMNFDPPVDVAASARANGVDGRVVDPDADLEGALADAIDSSGPVVVDVPVHD